jgi:outer membrane immunogenic protein
MKKLLLGCAFVTALVTFDSAFAADLARPTAAPVYKAPAMVPQAFSWTGLYLGLEGGYGWGRENYDDNTVLAPTPVSHQPHGGIFGGVLGYRYQTGQFVFGVEGSAAWAGINDTVASGFFTENLKARSIYTATGQVGWAFNQALLYAKGGWAGASVNNLLTGGGGTATNSQDANGWTVGAGLDYAVWQNVVLGIEYDHIDLGYGGYSAPFSTGGLPWIVTSPSHFTIDQVVGRLTYKFNPF